MGPVHNLTEEDLASINNGLQQIEQAKQAIALAKRAGIDVAAQEAAVVDGETKLRRIKSVYFPNR